MSSQNYTNRMAQNSLPDPDFSDIKETIEEMMKRIKDDKPTQEVEHCE